MKHQNAISKVKTVLLTALCAMMAMTNTVSATVSPSDTYDLPTHLCDGGKIENISLNGKWSFRYSPKHKWQSIQVPGEAAMQGYAIRHDEPFCYKRQVNVPSAFIGKRVILRFDGVYSHARLFVNNRMVREHHGGFTRWETDVTDYVKKGSNEIMLEVTDRLDDISYASGYAHHPIGGILRSVTLFALPKNHLKNTYIETELDSMYRDAVLAVYSTAMTDKDGMDVVFELTDPDGRKVSLQKSRFPLHKGRKEEQWRLPVANPRKWDAEHPNLYTLVATVMDGDTPLYSIRKDVGFRKIEINGDRMLVNGKQVKLRGACRHDIHPMLGRTTTAELDSLDAVLFKEANMNFVRTSHYPPSETFLRHCNRLGIYVECETGVCFVNTYRQKNYAPGNTQDNPEYADRYLGQCQEMVNAFRSHPSVLFWSIGNESAYGSNFQLCWDWVKAADTTRPVIFSYPGSVGEKKRIFDILSMHYQNVHGNLDQWGMSTRNFQGHGIPALFDEWAHPACYTYQTLQTDPNIREFWGKSIDMMWEGLYNAPGGLGGAIWGYIDETFMLPKPKVGTSFWKEFAHTAKPEGFRGDCVGYGEWGIVDVWRRKKPEFWSTKKAYSPIRLTSAETVSFTSGQRIVLPIQNRFDHTNFSEISASYTFNGEKKPLSLPALEPHERGTLTIPAEDWKNGSPLFIEFRASDGSLIDAYRPILGNRNEIAHNTANGKVLTLTENDSCYVVNGGTFALEVSRKTGLLTRVQSNGETVIENGPYLNAYVNLNHLSGAEVRKIANFYKVSAEDWQKDAVNVTTVGNDVRVLLKGSYKTVKVDYQINIRPDGRIDIDYMTEGLTNGYLREEGVSFKMANTMKTIHWTRRGYWNYYPDGEFAGNQESAPLYNARHVAYGENPNQPWAMDTHNYYYWADAGAGTKAPLTQKAKGMKENIYTYSLLNGNNHGVMVSSADADVSCRLNKPADDSLILYVNNRWDYPEIAWGNYCKVLEASPYYGKISLSIK